MTIDDGQPGIDPAKQWYLFVLFGVISGFSSALLGIGGGVVLMPLLLLVVMLEPSHARGTALGYMVLTCLVGALTFKYGDGVDLSVRVILLLSAGGVVGAVVGAKVGQRINPLWVKRAFAGVMVIAAVKMVWGTFGTSAGGAMRTSVDLGAEWYQLILFGLVSGFSSAMLGIGGGVVLMPLLMLVAMLEPSYARGSALGYMVLTCLIGSLTYHRTRGVHLSLRMIALLTVGGMAGAVPGAVVGHHIDRMWVKRLFAMLMVWAAYKMFRTTLKKRKALTADDVEAEVV